MKEESADLYKSKYRYLYDAKKPYIMSVSGMTMDDNIKILGDIFNEHRKCNISGVELNLSCPNIIGKPQGWLRFYCFRRDSETCI